MSCGACRIQDGPFAPEADWGAVKARLEALEPLGLEDPCSPSLAFGYRCPACGQVWRLCVPDEADPGGCFEAG